MEKIDYKNFLPLLVAELEKKQRESGRKQDAIICFEYMGRQFFIAEIHKFTPHLTIKE